MESLVAEIAKQVPALAVMAFIVATFLKHMEKRDVVIREIHADHIMERKETRISVDANTKAMATNTAAIVELGKALKE